MTAALRPDSGTPQADSTFARFRGVLDDDLRVINRVAFDRKLDDLFHITWMLESERVETLRHHGIADTAAARVIVDSLIRRLGAQGIWTRDGGEGLVFSVNEDTVAAVVGPLLSPAGRAYLTIASQEQHRPSANDASLMVSWDEFGDRLAADGFVSTYPTSPFTAEMRDRGAMFLRFYLRGSPGFDGRAPTLTEAAKTNMEHFLAVYGATPAGAIVRGYRDALKAQGYRGGKTLDEHLARQRP